jgi:membrane-associated phospholipid phosphatase
MATATEAVRRNFSLPRWLGFLSQCLIAVSVEVGDDLGRGLVSQHGTVQGIDNARQIVSFEAAHGLWWEPAWQLFFEHSHQIFLLSITWVDSSRVMNGIYVLGHVLMTLSVAAWVYFYRRRYFPLLRNTVIVTNALALVIYENFPVAPPRMMPPLPFNHHLFSFQDTLYGVLSASGHYVGSSSSLAYNEFSAMPSIHMAWALVVGAALLLLCRSFPLRLLGVVYPALMLVAIVVTANHYFLDAAAAVAVVAAAALIATAFDGARGRLPWQQAAVS